LRAVGGGPPAVGLSDLDLSQAGPTHPADGDQLVDLGELICDYRLRGRRGTYFCRK
jgi:hypothetical protein